MISLAFHPLLVLLAASPACTDDPLSASREDASVAPLDEEDEAAVEALDELRRHGSRAELEGAPPLASWLFDDLGRWRASLVERGMTLEAYLTVDASAHVSGGADAGSSAARGLFDALATFDAGRLFGVQGGTLVVGLQAYGGEDGSAEVGVLQPYSNIDDPDDRVQLARIWYEQRWRDGATHLRVGKMDANALFADVHSATDFLHSSMGFSPTVLGLPTYPDTAFGVAGKQAFGGDASLRLGVFDGAAQRGVKTGKDGPSTFLGEPDDLFLIAQAGWEWGSESERPGRLAVGAWRHTGDFARFDGGEEDGTDGLYLVLEQRIAGDAREGGGARALDAFLQLGQADEDVAEIAGHIGGGLVASNAFWPERADVLGLGFSSARLSDAAGAGFDAEAETALELFWTLSLVPGVRLEPDLQVVIDPGGDASRDEAWIATVRVTVSL